MEQPEQEVRMKLYKYHAGQVESVDVKETEKQYRVIYGDEPFGNHIAFDFRAVFPKDVKSLAALRIGLSKREALDIALKNFERDEMKALSYLKAAKESIGTVKKLIEAHNG